METYYHQQFAEDVVGSIEPSTLRAMNKTALDILMRMFRQQLGSMQRTAATATDPAGPLAPAERQCPPMPERCDEKPLWNALMGYGFLAVFLLALIGNCLNVLVYNSGQIRFFIAIRMLCTKLLMNTCMMVVMLPQALRVIRLWELGDSTDQLYWRLWPYQAYLTNVFGFCAMWLTVLMTAECFVHIFFPSHSKAVCTKRTVWRSYLLILITGLTLSAIYPLNRNVSLESSCQRTIVKILASQYPAMELLEKVHTLADMLLSILVPISLLVFMTTMIVWRLWATPAEQKRPPSQLLNNSSPNSAASRPAATVRGKHFAAEKRGVTRITLITCGLHLITETPSMSVLIFVSMSGPNVHKEAQICAWQTVSYFLCLCNASLSFFVYITFSTRFRKTMLSRFHLLLHWLIPSRFTESGSPEKCQKGGGGAEHHQQLPSNNLSCSSHLIPTASNKNETPPGRAASQERRRQQNNADDGDQEQPLLLLIGD